MLNGFEFVRVPAGVVLDSVPNSEVLRSGLSPQDASLDNGTYRDVSKKFHMRDFLEAEWQGCDGRRDSRFAEASLKARWTAGSVEASQPACSDEQDERQGPNAETSQRE